MKHQLSLLALLIFSAGMFAQETTLPKKQKEFKGKIGKTYKDSKEDYPQEIQAPKDAPNVILILLDDVGFGQPSLTGGPIPTPHIDNLATQGVTYTRFHTTAICSSSRAALLTGRNHHQVGNGTITELSTGYPGYNSFWNSDAASLAEILSLNGYRTAALGKWHNTPDWETSPAGPFDRWPTNLGFDYFYGFFGGETSQWEPQIIQNLTPVEPEKTPEEGYHFTVDMAEKATTWIKKQKSLDAERPVFMYFATGATHAPLHVPTEWADKFKGHFDDGWDAMRVKTLERQKKMGILPASTNLTSRPASIPAWADQPANAKKLYARQMEVFAGFLAHTDYHVGQMLEKVQKIPGMENTLVIYLVGDNGASAEGSMTGTTNNMMTQNGIPDNVESQLPDIKELGGPEFENHYAVPWSWAGCAPFQWMKRVPSHFGGTRNGMIISWPGHIEKLGERRTQFHHIIDIAPTILEAANIAQPEEVYGVKQIPIEGVSMLYSLDNTSAPSQRHEQYFEVGGNIAMYKDGWIATSFHREPWLTKGTTGFDNMTWNLYNIEEDWSQAHDLAKKNPKKLKELQDLFDQTAQKFNVYPLDDRFAERAGNPNRPSLIKEKNEFTYYGGMTRLTEGSTPPVYARSHDITIKFDYKKGDEGVLVCSGGSAAGYSIYIKDGKAHYYYNYFGKERYDVASKDLPEGQIELKMQYTQTSKEYAGGGDVVLSINGKTDTKQSIGHVVPVKFSATETMDVGMDLGAPVSNQYHSPFAYPSVIESVHYQMK